MNVNGGVVDGGNIALVHQTDDNVPDIATLKLSTLLNSTELGLGHLTKDIRDLELKIGAVAGRASMDGCDEMRGMAGAVDREYLTSHVDLNVESPLVGHLGRTVSDQVIGGLDETVNTLVLNHQNLNTVLEGITGAVTDAVSSVTGTLGVRVGQTGETIQIEQLDVDMSPDQKLLSKPSGDEVVSIVLSQRLVTINTAALFDEAYPEHQEKGLNVLPPNSNPLSDPDILGVLEIRLEATLISLISELQNALYQTIANPTVSITISIPIERRTFLGNWTSVGAVGLNISSTIEGLLDGDATVVVDTSILSSLLEGLLGFLGSLLGGLVEELTDAITERVVSQTVLKPLGILLSDVFNAAVTLPTDLLDTAGTPIIDLVVGLYDGLFVDGVVALTINVQNDPEVGQAGPNDWDWEEDRYDVAALRVGILDTLEDNGVRLYLGRGSVGPVCSGAGRLHFALTVKTLHG